MLASMRMNLQQIHHHHQHPFTFCNLQLASPPPSCLSPDYCRLQSSKYVNLLSLWLLSSLPQPWKNSDAFGYVPTPDSSISFLTAAAFWIQVAVRIEEPPLLSPSSSSCIPLSLSAFMPPMPESSQQILAFLSQVCYLNFDFVCICNTATWDRWR